MAGDWIKIEHTTPDKPEIVGMAATLRMDQDAVVGKLLRVWIWADQNSIDGNALAVTDVFLDRLTLKRGFAAAMRRAGWLEGDANSLKFPGFDRHNGTTAKSRAETNRRVAKHREGNKTSPPAFVPLPPPSNADVTADVLQKPLPEKRREEKSTDQLQQQQHAQARNRGTTLDEARAYAESYSKGNVAGITIPMPVVTQWHDAREAVGWVTVKGGIELPIADWQADLRTFATHYQKNEAFRPNGAAVAAKRAEREPPPAITAANLPRL